MSRLMGENVVEKTSLEANNSSSMCCSTFLVYFLELSLVVLLHMRPSQARRLDSITVLCHRLESSSRLPGPATWTPLDFYPQDPPVGILSRKKSSRKSPSPFSTGNKARFGHQSKTAVFDPFSTRFRRASVENGRFRLTNPTVV